MMMMQAGEKYTHHVEHRPTEEADRIRFDLALVYDLLHDASDLAGVHPDDNNIVVVVVFDDDDDAQRGCVLNGGAEMSANEHAIV